MAALVALETVVLAVVVVLVAGLLRSHARILAVLESLGIGAGVVEGRPVGGSDSAHRPGSGIVDVQLARRSGGPVVDIIGTTPSDETVSVSITSPRVDTLLAFLSAGCSTCVGLWDELRAGDAPALPDRARLVIVTLSPGEESVSRLARLAPPDTLVVMSSDAWQDYEVPGAPYFIWISGPERRVRGEGSARSWHEVASLMRDAGGDAARRRTRREQDVDAELAAAGILPGDPRLHHRRSVDAPGP